MQTLTENSTQVLLPKTGRWSQIEKKVLLSDECNP